MAETKAQFRQRLARVLNIMHTATTSGTGSTTTVVALSLVDYYPVNDTLNGSFIYDVSASEARRVSDWDASTGTATVSRAFSNSQSSGRSIVVFEQFTPEDLDNALLMALTETYPYIVGRVVDTSLTGVANQYEYTVPSTIRELSRMRGGSVAYQVNTAASTFPYARINHWEVRESGGGSKTLVIEDIRGAVGRTLRLIGWGVLSYPSTDATTIDLEEDTLQLLAWKAAEITWRTGPRLTDRDAEFAKTMSSYWAEQYESHKDTWGVRMLPEKLESPDDFPQLEAPLAYYHASPS